MKHIFTLISLLSFGVMAQVPENFIVEIEPLTITNAPGVHSFSVGVTDDNKWVVLGGRIDGLHQRQPFAAFLEQDNNKSVYVIDPVNEQVWSSDLSVLSASLFEQLQSTNQNFHQRDTMLYIVGGYGYSATAADHITFPNLVAISINELAAAVIAGSNIVPYFRQITDVNLKVTGGHLGLLNDLFYLVGGQLFDGRYNPMGPTQGPGFIQQYTDEIRTFNIDDDGVNLTVSNYSAQHDAVNLHRRDYNMSPQIFPNGDHGFTAFSGVFDPNDLPYLNSVDITNTGYTVNNTFNQYLSQYHSAKIPVHDVAANTMHTLFFGGLSQFTLDAQNNLVEDTEVPFVKTISRVTRSSNGTMQEINLGYVEMPALLGAGAEFIQTDDYFVDNILNLNSIPQTKTLVGYIYGGIESSAENIFFINDGTQSWANNTIFKVFINKEVVGLEEFALNDNSIINLNVFPNPVGRKMTVNFFAAQLGEYDLNISDTNGKIVLKQEIDVEQIGTQETIIKMSDLAPGTYTITLSDGLHVGHINILKD